MASIAGLALSTITSFFLRTAGALFSFLFAVVLARSLGPEETGYFYLALAVSIVLGTGARLGIDLALVRQVAIHASREEWVHIAFLHDRAAKLLIVSGLLTSLLMLGLAEPLAAGVFGSPDAIPAFRWMAACILPFCFAMFYGECFKAIGKVVSAHLVQHVAPLAVCCALIYLLRDVASASLATGLYVGAFLLAASVAHLVWRLSIPSQRYSGPAVQLHISGNSPLVLVTICAVALPHVTTFAVARWDTSAAVAEFNLAFRVASLIGFVGIAVQTISLPRFSVLNQDGDKAALSSLAIRHSMISACLAVPLAMAVLISPAEVMRLFGSAFESSTRVLQIMVCGQLVSAVTSVAGPLLIATERARAYGVTFALSFAISGVLAVALTAGHGVLGGAIATSVGTALPNLLALALYIAYRRHTVAAN